jgi:diguanylate cyclase
LSITATGLLAGLRAGDLLARLGGDEFVVASMAPQENSAAGREALTTRLQELTCGNFDLGVSRINYAGASVGAVTSEPGLTDADALIARADAALYEIKKNQRQR